MRLVLYRMLFFFLCFFLLFFFFQAEDGIRDLVRSRGLGDVYKRQALYSIVKNTTFNGINLPDITVIRNTKLQIVKRFGYKDYKCRQS